jgi:lysophospholipase L1-like esterase
VDAVEPLDYANLTGRPAGPFVTAMARVVRGVGAVQAQVVPYARAWHAANVVALARTGPRWVVLGDSMSLGVGASRFDAGWVNQVRDRLAGDGVEYQIVNLSASGARVADVLDQQLPALRSLPARTDADPRPDLVTVLVGSNDLFRKRFRQELPATYRRLLGVLPAGAVVATLPNPRGAALAVNRSISRAEAEGAVTVVDLRSGGGGLRSWRGKLAQDHFHPNDAGYADLAGAFYRVLSGPYQKAGFASSPLEG